MVRKPVIEYRENVRGGEGTIEFAHILSQEEMLGHGTMFAKLTVPAHGSLGFHRHETNTEPYYIVSGKGIFVDNDGSRTEVSAGDVCVINVGDGHAIENPYDEPLEFIAVILNDRS